MEIPSFNALIQKSIIDHWDMDALTDYKGATLQYLLQYLSCMSSCQTRFTTS